MDLGFIGNGILILIIRIVNRGSQTVIVTLVHPIGSVITVMQLLIRRERSLAVSRVYRGIS